MWRRIAPALLLFVLAPFTGELLEGSTHLSMGPALVVEMLMYGGGAVLIRELTRRLGRGWPTILLLAGAYGVLEEGLWDKTLFNPDWAHLHLLDYGFLPGPGTSPVWGIFVLTLHFVWSISVPIALVEALVPDRSRRPWLGGVGLPVVAVLYLLGALAVWAGTNSVYPYTDTPAQLIFTLAAAALLVVAALAVARRPAARPAVELAAGQAGRAPGASLVGVVSFVASAVFMAQRQLFPSPVHAPWEVPVLVYLAVIALMIVLVTVWSRRAGWGLVHVYALAAGAFVTYTLSGLKDVPSLGALDLVGQLVVAALAVVFLLLVGLRLRTRRAAAPIGAPMPAAPAAR
jgi:hypothetical protein